MKNLISNLYFYPLTSSEINYILIYQSVYLHSVLPNYYFYTKFNVILCNLIFKILKVF